MRNARLLVGEWHERLYPAPRREEAPSPRGLYAFERRPVVHWRERRDLAKHFQHSGIDTDHFGQSPATMHDAMRDHIGDDR